MEHTLRTVSFGVLGPLVVDLGDHPVRLGGLKLRRVLAMLLINAGRTVSVDRLIEGLWEDQPPDGAVNTLQVHVSHLRRVLADGEVPLVTQPPGYQLRVRPEQLDLLRFEQLAGLARERADADLPAEAAEALSEALSLWRGPALEDIGSGSFADNARTFLHERRWGVTEDLLRLRLRLGQYPVVVEECTAMVAEHPLRESWWELLMVALYRAGRPAEALAGYQRCRRVLLEELGVEPMPQLQRLERQILNHDRRLDPGPATASVVLRRPVGAGREAGATTQLRAQRLDSVLEVDELSTVPLGTRTVIGRNDECDVVLTSPEVSRRHAEIRLVSGRHLLLDLSSANGTWLAGEPVLQRLLDDGDVVSVGQHQLRYRIRRVPS
ncbi:BTAD domain-containing putative transcriptional regulator [Nocardioides sp. HB32]